MAARRDVADTRHYEFMTPVSSIVILGTDALLAAMPATPVQLAHACLALGYTGVFPASWGDELVAASCLRHLAERGEDAARGAGPVIQCSCPLVTGALLEVGAELAPFIVPLVAPPIAAARLLRTLHGATPLHITYAGACPFGSDASIDARVSPNALLSELEDRGIVLLEQPHVFEGIIPPDRSRFYSLPGGVPAPDAMLEDESERTLIVLDGADFKIELAQHLLSRERALVDIAPRLGCLCSGATSTGASRFVRDTVAALEPPRSESPVLPGGILVEVELPLLTHLEPAQAASPVAGAPAYQGAAAPSAVAPTDPGGALPGHVAASRGCIPAGPAHVGSEVAFGAAVGAPGAQPSRDELATPFESADAESPAESPNTAHAAAPGAVGTAIAEPPEPTPSSPRRRYVAAGAVPVTRTGEGRVLPRAYAARRRTPAGELDVVTAATGAPGVLADVVVPVPSEKAEVPDGRGADGDGAEQAARARATRAVFVPIPNVTPRTVPPPPLRDRGRLLVTILALLIAALALLALTLQSLGGVTPSSPEPRAHGARAAGDARFRSFSTAARRGPPATAVFAVSRPISPRRPDRASVGPARSTGARRDHRDARARVP